MATDSATPGSAGIASDPIYFVTKDRWEASLEFGSKTTSLFWDCECASNFIHPHHEEICTKCGSHRDEQPDSQAVEVVAHTKLIVLIGDQPWLLKSA